MSTTGIDPMQSIRERIKTDLQMLLTNESYKKIYISDRNNPIYIDITKVPVKDTLFRVVIWENKDIVASFHVNEIKVETSGIIGYVGGEAVVALTPDIWRIQACKTLAIVFDQDY